MECVQLILNVVAWGVGSKYAKGMLFAHRICMLECIEVDEEHCNDRVDNDNHTSSRVIEN